MVPGTPDETARFWEWAAWLRSIYGDKVVNVQPPTEMLRGFVSVEHSGKDLDKFLKHRFKEE